MTPLTVVAKAVCIAAARTPEYEPLDLEFVTIDPPGTWPTFQSADALAPATMRCAHGVDSPQYSRIASSPCASRRSRSRKASSLPLSTIVSTIGVVVRSSTLRMALQSES